MILSTCTLRGGVAMLAVAALASCSSGGPKFSGPTATSSAAKETTANLAEPPGGYDVSRIANLANQLPPGFTVTPVPRTTLTQEQADSLAGLSQQFAFTFDPPHCNSVLKPAGVEAGAVSQGFLAHGPQELSVIAAQSPHAAVNPVVGAGCNHVTFKAQEGAQGSAETLPGPAIDGATTSLIKLHMDFAVAGFSKTIDRLSYSAALSDQTGVLIEGESDPHLLEDLLAKAVAVLRAK